MYPPPLAVYRPGRARTRTESGSLSSFLVAYAYPSRRAAGPASPPEVGGHSTRPLGKELASPTDPGDSTPPDPAAVARALCSWFVAHARDLPWRVGPAGSRDAYATLVSELMLQQTQVSRVLDAFERFMARFPTIDALARAEESEVLSAWTGLGYYRRARLLQAAARALVERHAGVLPTDPREIAALPGVGAYTLGALASLCHDLPTPAVDGNVLRVLLRLAGSDADTTCPRTLRWARDRARDLLMAGGEGSAEGVPRRGSGLLNEALIELGALICTARAPACDRCPLRACCRSRAMGLERSIPGVKRSTARRLIHCATLIVRDARGRVLIEQRPRGGLWGGLWQAPTLERDNAAPSARAIREFLPVDRVRELDRFEFRTTHRTLRFVCYGAMRPPGARLAVGGRRWAGRSALESLALSSPQRRILLDRIR